MCYHSTQTIGRASQGRKEAMVLPKVHVVTLSRFVAQEQESDLSIITRYIDASDVDCLITHKSTEVHTMWKIGQSPVVTLSTAESELVQIGIAT